MKTRQAARQAQAPAQPQAREVPLAMGMLAWVMMGLAVWHFTIFLPDRCWGGIVGAFLGALVGAVVFGLGPQRLHDPRRLRHLGGHRGGGDPGRDARDRVALYLLGIRAGARGAPRARLRPGPSVAGAVRDGAYAAPSPVEGPPRDRAVPDRRDACAAARARGSRPRWRRSSPAGGSATSRREPGPGWPPTRRTTRWPGTGWAEAVEGGPRPRPRRDRGSPSTATTTSTA